MTNAAAERSRGATCGGPERRGSAALQGRTTTREFATGRSWPSQGRFRIWPAHQSMAEPPPSSAPVAPPAPPVAAGGRIPAQVVALLQRMRAEVERNCDYVGENFAEEARKIHYREAPERAIRGNATGDEIAELQDEGIEVLAIPIPKSRTSDSH